MELKGKFNLKNMIILDKDSINFDEGRYFANNYFIKMTPNNNNYNECDDAFHKSIVDSSYELRRRLHLMTLYDFEFVTNCLLDKHFCLVKEPVKLGKHYDNTNWHEILKFYYLVLVDNRIRLSCVIEDINTRNYEGIKEIRKIYPEFLCNYSTNMKEEYSDYKRLYRVIVSLIDEFLRKDEEIMAKSVHKYMELYSIFMKSKKEKIIKLIESDFFIETNIKKLEYNNSEFYQFLELAIKLVNKQDTEEEYDKLRLTMNIANKIISTNEKKIKAYNKKRS